ncbi:MAG: UDP-3-O-acyl-N-acetylglucosamine deacetylase, partial [Phycisphaerales bacterium]
MTAAPTSNDPRTATPVPTGARRQRTIASAATVAGKGLLLGREATLTILPAPPDHGIVFERTDLDRPAVIPALVTNVVPNARRTTLKSGEATIETVEHCMSALRGLGIDNVLLRLNGPELPCGDGSAMPFVAPIQAAGIAEQDALRRTFKLTEAIVVEEG